MLTLTLTRKILDSVGTFGYIDFDGERFCTVERPWLDNATGVSCIPEGTYLVSLRPSHKLDCLGRDSVYEVRDVPGRTNIEIHVANYPTDVEGCIGLGYGMSPAPIAMVTQSKLAVEDFYHKLAEREFTLIIQRTLH